MPVYVDNIRIPFRRMKMSHLMADTTEELLAMADAIKLDRRHIQHPGTPTEHFDVSVAYRLAAIRNGAQPVQATDLARLVRDRRNGQARPASY